ncbi:hypothetical protein HK101_010994 [Irineochytrium annulatum]|nr:hypothetical protein HK101_010994 [Irineochytrium annulatum]
MLSEDECEEERVARKPVGKENRRREGKSQNSLNDEEVPYEEEEAYVKAGEEDDKEEKHRGNRSGKKDGAWVRKFWKFFESVKNGAKETKVDKSGSTSGMKA